MCICIYMYIDINKYLYIYFLYMIKHNLFIYREREISLSPLSSTTA